MKKPKKSERKINRRGDISLYFILLGAILFAISFIIYMGRLETNLQKVGESTVKVINTFEMSERLLFYTDASIELASKEAKKEVIRDSGYLQEIFKGKVQNYGCGTLAYPIIDTDRTMSSSKGINECFPNYEDEFKILFTRNFNKLIINYDPLELDPSSFDVLVKKESTGLKVKVQGLSDINLPVYSYIESYYRNADKTKTSKLTPNTVTKTSEGYLTMRSYLVLNSFDRQGTTPTRIIIHDTKTSTVQETFAELQTGLKNYNYVIDRTGEIYIFAPETKYTKNSGCTKGGTQSTCIIEDTDKESVSVALVNNLSSSTHPQVQINSLINLISEISTRNPTIQITDATILLNSEIDSSRANDPAYDIELMKGDIISKSLDQKNSMIIQQTGTQISHVPAQNSQGNTLTGNAAIPPDVDLGNCFNNIRTTLYYTPDLADHGNIWSTHATPCPNSYGYCCIPENNRGFYEDVMCQGSGVADGQVYHYTTISPAGLSQSTPIPGLTRGKTNKGKDPTPKRTVAADQNCPGFNYGSKLYIYWGENNPWNGYYVVEDTGSAFMGRCDKMDIYAGVGKAELQDAAKYVAEYGKVCVLDSTFQMPDPDFSGLSEFVDPVTGEYNVPYGHDITVKEITTLFDSTKQFLEGTINRCIQFTDELQKDACINGEIQNAKTVYKLNITYCDDLIKERIWTTADADADMPLVVNYFKKNYMVMGTITQINIDNTDLFAAFTGQAGTKSSILNSITKIPAYAIITIADESGKELNVNISGSAIEWVDYINKSSTLYERDGFLKQGSKILINVTRELNSTYSGYYINRFNSISEYPEEIIIDELLRLAKTIYECATSKTACICTTEKARMLDMTMIEGNEIISLTGSEEIRINVPFTAAGGALFDASSAQKFKFEDGKISLIPVGDSVTLPDCAPAKRYKYICSALMEDEDLGTIGYALKI